MELKKVLNFKDAVSILFNAMVGTGIFFSTGYILKDIPFGGWVLVCWLLGGLFAITGALTIAYPATLFPKAGGDYVYLKEAYSPIVAFTSGWASLIANFSASISVLALSFSQHLLLFLPESWSHSYLEAPFLGVTFAFGPKQLISASIVLIFTVLNVLGLELAVRLQNGLTAIKLLGLLIFVGLGAWMMHLPIQEAWSFGHPATSVSLSHIASALIPISFSYLGWNMIAYVAEEVIDPQRQIVRSTVVATLAVIALYVMVNAVILGSAPISELTRTEEVGVTAAIALFGAGISPWATVLICIVLLGSLMSLIIGGPRIYYAMAKDGLFFKGFGNLHPRYGTPSRALWLQALFAGLALLIKEIETLLYMITCSILILSVLSACTPFIFIRRGLRSYYKIPGYPWVPLLFIASNIGIFALVLRSDPVQALWGLAITLSAVPVYFFFRRWNRD